MSSVRVQELGADRFQLDLDFRDVEGLIASYALPGPDGWTIIDDFESSGSKISNEYRRPRDLRFWLDIFE